MTGPAFSSVNLRILSPDGKTVLAELQTLDRANVRTARNIGAAQTAALQQVQRQAATSARAIAGNIAGIAAAGEATAGSLKGIVTQGANIAFMFGTGGAIAGAIGATGLAIFNLFSRTREEIEKTARKAAEELRALTQGGNIGAVGGRYGAATQLFSGDRLAVRADGESQRAFQARQMGIQGIQAEIARQQARYDAAPSGPLGQGRRNTAYNEIVAWNRELAKMVPQYEKLIALTGQLSEQAGHSASIELNQLRARGDSESARLLGGLTGRGLPTPSAIGFGMKAFNPVEFTASVHAGITEALKNVPPVSTSIEDAEWILDLDRTAESIGMSFGQSLANSISTGIETAFQRGANIGNVFAALTGAVLQGLGGMFQQIGASALIGLSFIQKIKDAIIGFAPGLGIAAALGLIALGAALSGAGARMGANSAVGGGGGAGGYGGGFGSGGTIVDRGLINPLNPAPNTAGLRAITPNVHNWTVIGPDDPKAQRDIMALFDKGNARRAG